MTSYQFRVRVDREPTEPELDALGAVCDDAGLSYGNGQAELDLDPLVSVLDIAERTGRSREAVRQAITGMRARRFPPPVNGPGARHRLWRWSEVAAFYGIDDERTRQAARVADAANGWLALRRSAPGVTPSADAVADALRAA
jgi:hypothetical protein